MNKLFLVLLIAIMYSCKKDDSPKANNLNQNWAFKNVKDTIWHAAEVPGEVHSDLFRNGTIEDPFVANNELDLQWISSEDWEYKTNFKVDEETLLKKHLELDFKGLDTYATVYLNGKEILKTNNAFREFLVDVKSIIKAENELHIVFESTTKAEKIEKEKLPYELPAGDRIFTRKPQFHYGWDWGPVLTSSGVSRPIILKSWNDFKIEDVYFNQKTLNDTLAEIEAQFEVKTLFKDPITVEIYVNNILNTKTELEETSKTFSIPIQIKNPKKWWPHNIGEPYLYNIKTVVKQGRRTLDSYTLKKGLRTIELVTEKDSIGESFYFKVNDIPVYAKGANYIPQHSFQNQVKIEDYKRILGDAVDANMNMLRVWGGGIYEDDIFYELCDEKGIMVWQDFMFACAMYPGDDNYLENVKQEAIDNVKRLRNHSSIALWCGNNENNEAWHRWGWQTGRSEDEKNEIWGNYLKLFDTLLPQVVNDYHNEIDYWESSPRYGRGNPLYKTEGDAHDWWIWHDEYPFEHLQDAVPRFMSEFGFQAFPSYEAIKYINGNESTSVSSKAFDTHQKHPRGYSIIKNYMERDYPVPDNDEDYVYMSQLMQANGMVMGFEAQRRAKPYNMGTLYWQLNDCWPVISWSSIDFLGNWKAMHYKTKKAFEDVLISSRVVNDTLNVYLINDDLESYKGDLKLKIIDFNGNLLHEVSKPIDVEADSSEIKYKLDITRFNKDEVVVISTFKDEISLFYLGKYKALKLQKGDIKQTVTKTDDGFSIELSSKILQKDVFLISEAKGHFSDNFFDILPNETKVIEFKSKANEIKDFRIKTFNNLVR
ncbi:glycoside hydrolase family 2 protein [uncultured Lacinutrix sp.]|uniref:beta-mannosidase n=1 Tax=uncultured Lacinutrix sp. TaxID=574032 RepID=UPI00260C8DE7|nr:glycoside hydrolase family 2 protein [uncultured Lacinutrix sp.]